MALDVSMRRSDESFSRARPELINVDLAEQRGDAVWTDHRICPEMGLEVFTVAVDRHLMPSFRIRSRQHLWAMIAVLLLLLTAPTHAEAQEAVTLTGMVRDVRGAGLPDVLVRIQSLNVGATTGADGAYRLVIPGSRIRAGQAVQVTASRTGMGAVTKSVTLSPGADLAQVFVLQASAIQLERRGPGPWKGPFALLPSSGVRHRLDATRRPHRVQRLLERRRPHPPGAGRSRLETPLPMP